MVPGGPQSKLTHSSDCLGHPSSKGVVCFAALPATSTSSDISTTVQISCKSAASFLFELVNQSSISCNSCMQCICISVVPSALLSRACVCFDSDTPLPAHMHALVIHTRRACLVDVPRPKLGARGQVTAVWAVASTYSARWAEWVTIQARCARGHFITGAWRRFRASYSSSSSSSSIMQHAAPCLDTGQTMCLRSRCYFNSGLQLCWQC